MATLDEVLAHGALSRAGSVMAKPQQPDWRRQLPQILGPTAGTLGQTILDLVDSLVAFGPGPLDAAPGLNAAAGAVTKLARPTKAGIGEFAQAPKELTVEGLIQALAGGKASMPGRGSLRPALRKTSSGEIAASGSIGSGHGPLYEAIPPAWQKQVEHGFLHPEGPFLNQALIDVLVQPQMVKKMDGLLQRGMSLDTILSVLRQ